MGSGAGGWGSGGGLPPWQGGGSSDFGPPPGAPPGSFGPPGGFGPPPGAPPGPAGGYRDPVPGTPHSNRGPSGDWSPTDALAFGWERVKAEPIGIILPMFVAGMIGSAPSMLGNILQQLVPKSSAVQIVSMVLGLIGMVLAVYMNGGVLVFLLKTARGEKGDLGDIFKGGPFFLSLLGSGLLIGFASLFGGLLLLAPGVYLALAWSLTSFLIVDKELGAIDAMRESWSLTDGHKVNLLLLGLLSFFIGLAVAVLTCCVGLFVVNPIIQLSFAYAYLKISGQETA